MANLSFDFNKVKRSFMTVTLKDNRKLIVKMPMKKTLTCVFVRENLKHIAGLHSLFTCCRVFITADRVHRCENLRFHVFFAGFSLIYQCYYCVDLYSPPFILVKIML